MSATASKPSKSPSESQALVRKQNVPVQMTDLSIFDETYVSMKERFSEEIKRMDQHMFALGKALSNFYNQNLTVQTGLTSITTDELVGWDDIASSPLVEGEGDEKMLRLQFDVSQFDPEEIEVRIEDNVLSVSAIHDEKSDTSAEHREYHRYFSLPKDTDPESVISSLSKDGVLTVQAPLKLPDRKQPKLERPSSK